jgi:hypothetical protein
MGTQQIPRLAAQDVARRRRRIFARNARRPHRHADISLARHAAGNAWPAGQIKLQRQHRPGRGLGRAVGRLCGGAMEGGQQRQDPGERGSHRVSMGAAG